LERRIEMKRRLSTGLILVMVALLSVSVASTTAFAWSQSVHAYVAKKCLGLDYKYIASYNARMGSIVPDFFWHLRDNGYIDLGTADILHGLTEQACVGPETTYFYEIALGNLKPWQYGLKYFTEGIKTHVYADIKAHDPDNGYIARWIDVFLGEEGVDEGINKEALHLALELSVDALLIHEKGMHLGDILLSYTQANFLERAVEEALGGADGFDVSQEFKKYLALMRILEKIARLYAPYLIRGEVDAGFISQALSWEFLEAVGELPEESLGNYLNVALILLNYPGEIYYALTYKNEEQDLRWKKAVYDAINFCRNPDFCE
jgi:hypothetical protein